jgi:hypothetical protein
VTSQDVPAAEAKGLSKELLESAAIKVDSDQAANLALSYAAANQAKVSFLNYELARQGARAVPVWVVTCLDQNVQPLGSVVITASRGNVVASEGFPNKPGAAQASQPVQKAPAETPPRVVGIDPRIAMSDREFLEAHARESTPAPTPRIEGLPPTDEPESWAPPERQAPPPIAASKTSKSSRSSKAKGTPTPPPRIASRTRELPPEAIIGIPMPPEPDDANDDDRRDQEWDVSNNRPHRRSEPVRFSSEDDLPRKVQHVRRFIHRLLPF